MAIWISIVTLLVLFAFYPSAASGTRPAGPVTIETFIHFQKTPFHGKFVVLEGALILGCSKGVFVDTPQGAGAVKEFTCLSGPGAGDTFTVHFEPWVGAISGGNANGHWRVVEGTGFFATLHGEGDFFKENVGFYHAVETLTGNVHFGP